MYGVTRRKALGTLDVFRLSPAEEKAFKKYLSIDIIEGFQVVICQVKLPRLLRAKCMDSRELMCFFVTMKNILTVSLNISIFNVW